MKKIIGITGPSIFTESLRNTVVDFFGAIPLDINQNGDDIGRVASMCDSFIFGGGVDIFPTSLKGLQREVENGHYYSKFDKRRDLRELALIAHAAETGKKIFGICRGHQMLLSNAGMYLLEDISSYSTVCHNPKEIEVQDEPIHYLHGFGNGIEEFGKLHLVNSFHHQAIHHCPATAAQCGVDILGVSHTVYGKSTGKHKTDPQFIVELARGKNFLSCQWHPEHDWHNVVPSRKVLQMAKDMFAK